MMSCEIDPRASGDGWWIPNCKEDKAATARKRKSYSRADQAENDRKAAENSADKLSGQTEHQPASPTDDAKSSLRELRRKERYERNRYAAFKFYEELTESSILDNVGVISDMSLPFRNSTIFLFFSLALAFTLAVTAAFLWNIFWQIFPRAQILEVSMLIHLLSRLFEKYILDPFKMQLYTPICCANGIHDHIFTKNCGNEKTKKPVRPDSD